MKNFHLSWTGGNKGSPDPLLVEEKLQTALTEGGVVTLDADDEFDNSMSLQVRIEASRFLLTFGWSDGARWNMKVFAHPDSRELEGSSSLLGDVWLNRLQFEDFDIVRSTFLDLLDGKKPSGENWL